MNWPAVSTSIQLAFVTTLILLVLGPPLAYWLATSRRKWTFLVQAVVALPLILPPTVLGFYVLVALGPQSPIGRGYDQLFGSTLPFTFQGLVIASVLYSLPFAVQPMVAAFSSVSPRLIEASWTLGVSRLGTFWRVVIPQSLTGLVTGTVLCFAHTIGEFGVVLMVGGNIEGQTRTISIAIYDDVQALNFAQANTTAALLLLFSFVILAAVYAVNRKVWTATPY